MGRALCKRLMIALLAFCVTFGVIGCHKSLEEERKNETPEMQQMRQQKKGD